MLRVMDSPRLANVRFKPERCAGIHLPEESEKTPGCVCRTMRYFRHLPPPKRKKPMRSGMGFGWCSPGALGWGKRLTPYRG